MIALVLAALVSIAALWCADRYDESRDADAQLRRMREQER